jgi:murein DD-endopeptidase MepM/ murein hydrolase activator NlpD
MTDTTTAHLSSARARRRPLIRGIALTGVMSLLAASILLATPTPAWAKDYPSWDDVTAARSDEASTTRAIADIQNLLATLRSEVVAAQADADAKGDMWIEADLVYQEAVVKTEKLQAQAGAATDVAEASRTRIGQMAAQMSRGISADSSTLMFGSTGNVDDLLYGLSLSSKLAEQSNNMLEKATADRNTAQALTDQAEVAATVLAELKATAEAAFVEAQEVSALAEAKVVEQADNEARLNQQLTVLTERRTAVETDYQAGVAERQAAAARAAAAAALAASEVSSSGWARPVSGYISSPFGWRIHPIAKVQRLHTGTDISSGCGQPQYSASSGTVTYAGRNGGYGNFVLIDNGGGISTAYAHIVDGGILVSKGQQVSVGQNIARTGTTGASTGCHSHFEVRQNGVTIDPVPFLRDRGTGLG